MDPAAAGAIIFQSQKQSSSQDWQLAMTSVLHNMLRAVITPPYYLLKLTRGIHIARQEPRVVEVAPIPNNV